MIKGAKRKAHRDLQFAALPWRVSDIGLREVMLLTTRETHRLTIPKGWPMKGRKPAEVAAQEAYEEAGLIGQIVGSDLWAAFITRSGSPKRRSSVRSVSSCFG
jgi:8-oxo-dGTP pyrophosphatase MutT (NUDIX family)